jgi:hypothetical protein
MTFPTIPLAMLPSDLQGSDNTARANIMLNAFRIAVNGSLSVQNMVDGVVDEFEDEAGVDTTASTDETYDSSGDYYHNPGGYSSNVLTGQTYTSAALFNGPIGNLFDGSEATEIRWGDDTPNWARVEFASAKTLTGWRYRTGSSDVSQTTGFNVYGSNDGSGWTLLDSVIIGEGNHAFNTWYGPYAFDTTGSYKYYKFVTTPEGTNLNTFMCEIEGYEATTTPNMVLQSNAFTAEALPDEAFLVVWQEEVDGVTLNTDLLAHVSRDGGTTWTQVILAEEAELSTGRVVAAPVDISGQPSGTSMKWKLAVANNKEQRIHGVGLSWS